LHGFLAGFTASNDKMFTVGQEVRALVGDGSQSRRGAVLLVGDGGDYEVLLTRSGRYPEEETTIAGKFLSPVHEFELSQPPPTLREYANTWKTNGNTLFADKDYALALEYYRTALSSLGLTSTTRKTYELGEAVIVTYTNTIDCYPGMISDVDPIDRTADVELETTDEVENEVCGVSYDLLLPLCNSEQDQLMQRSLYMNMARCFMKLDQKGWAIKNASLAIAVTLAYAQHHPEVAKLLADCYYFRAKALIAACRPKFATQV
jgi:tetratricopeptide (TPR) repeat protein